MWSCARRSWWEPSVRTVQLYGPGTSTSWHSAVCSLLCSVDTVMLSQPRTFVSELGVAESREGQDATVMSKNHGLGVALKLQIQ